MAKRRSFGKLKKVPRKTFKGGFAYEASFNNPRFGEPDEPRRIVKIFRKSGNATSWLSKQQTLIEDETWRSPLQLERHKAEILERGAHRTFAEFTKTWLETSEYEPSVERTNESLLRIHLLPKWGSTPIGEITREQVLLWGINKLAPGRPGARKNAYGLFSVIMGMAAELEAITSNPCTKRITEKVMQSCQSMKSSRHQPRSLSGEEISAIVSELPESSLPMFQLMLMTGIRLGEARELRWKDIDFEESRMAITRAVSGDGKTLAVSTPKTAKSERVRVLGVHTLRLLERQHEGAVRKSKTALIFPSVSDPGKHYSAALFNKNLRNAAKRAGIDHFSAHDLRNTWADRGGRNAESVKDVQDALGHTTASMSIHYMKSNDRAQRALQDAVETSLVAAFK